MDLVTNICSILVGVDPEDEEDPSFSGLNDFSDCLSKFTRYSNLRPLATLSYTTDMFNNASIVSSIEFDKDKVISSTEIFESMT